MLYQVTNASIVDVIMTDTLEYGIVSLNGLVVNECAFQGNAYSDALNFGCHQKPLRVL